jgi:hypothetical protein
MAGGLELGGITLNESTGQTLAEERLLLFVEERLPRDASIMALDMTPATQIESQRGLA